MIGPILDRPRGDHLCREDLLGLARETLAVLRELPARPGISGSIGDALFACALSRIDPSVDTELWLARAIQAVNAHKRGASLHRGVAGLGFVLATYADAEPLLSKIDEMLVGALSRLPPASMQSGVAGIALYASLRSNAAGGRRLQQAVIATLAAAATPSDGGLLWHTPPSYGQSRGLLILGEPITEFGMIHGIAGTLVALSALAQCGYDQAAELARAGLAALWAWERPGENRFGRILFGPNGSPTTVEFAGQIWCVGDPGVFRACWVAANAAGDASSAERALARLRATAERAAVAATVGEQGRIDLCCGASAIAQVYWRMYLETRVSIFRIANERLLAECARLLSGIGGPSFAYGRAGVLLALLSPRLDDAPTWDSLLGISLPPANPQPSIHST